MKVAPADAVLLAVVPLCINALSFEERLSFYPRVPMERSNVTAKMFLTTPTPCEKVELQDFRIKGHDISINVKVTSPSPDTICAQVLKEHLLEQK